MVQAEQMQNCRVQVVDVDFVLRGVITVVVGRAVARARFNAGSGQPHRIAIRVMVAAVAAFGHGRAPEFAAPDDQRVFEQPARFEIRKQSGDRLVDFERVFRVSGFQAAVLIPFVTVRDLDEAHAAFGEAPRHQALPAEVLGRLLVEAVEFQGRGRFAGDVLQFGDRRLHAEGEFK